ncbi:MAG TPA: type II toxin-antitoxin system VapC family toxin [Stellaceae bacterium]|nr:type II toxin-antitoxin system VapC family toxin [Stellaceae bacterium]
MTRVVVDASIAVSWCFDDEASAATEAILDQVRLEGAIVPGLWHLELANVLLQAERMGRPIPEGISARLEYFSRLPISTDAETASRAWRDTLSLARTEQLTTYDASYLELAARHGLPLATKDEALLNAAKRIGVAVLPG